MDSNNDLVSIIIPIYNVKEYLPKCIDSVEKQTYKRIEVLLVDDGSTDGCTEMLDSYQLDERFSVFHKENGGLSDARNYGLDRMSGQYVFFLDSDDYLEKDAIEICMNKMKESDADIVECKVKHVCSEKSFVHVRPDVGEYNNREALRGILDYRFRIVAWNKLYRGSLWENIRFPKGKINEDEHVLPYIVERCRKYVAIADPLYNYIQRQGSIMNSGFGRKRLSLMDAHEKRLSYFSKKYNGIFIPVIQYRYCLVLERMYKEAKNSEYHEKIKKRRNEMILTVIKNSKISLLRKMNVFVRIVFC